MYGNMMDTFWRLASSSLYKPECRGNEHSKEQPVQMMLLMKIDHEYVVSKGEESRPDYVVFRSSDTAESELLDMLRDPTKKSYNLNSLSPPSDIQRVIDDLRPSNTTGQASIDAWNKRQRSNSPPFVPGMTNPSRLVANVAAAVTPGMTDLRQQARPPQTSQMEAEEAEAEAKLLMTMRMGTSQNVVMMSQDSNADGGHLLIN